MIPPEKQIEPIASYRERRKYVRYNEGAMQVWVKRRSLLREFIKGEAVEWLNFNQHGMAFASNIHLNIHEEVLINLKIGNFSIHALVAVIHNARRQAGKYRYGVQFSFGANSHMKSHEIKELLCAVEQLLT